LPFFAPDRVATGTDATNRFGGSLLDGKPMKINMKEFNDHLAGLANGDPAVRRKAISELAKYSGVEWQGNSEAVSAAVAAVVNGSALRAAKGRDEAFRAEAAKALGNIGLESPAVLPELLRLLEKDADAGVRTEAARALGKIGEGAAAARRAITAVLRDTGGGDALRAAAAWALARVAPSAPATAAALSAAANDRSGHVGVCAAEALWKVSGKSSDAVLALAARLDDLAVRHAAAHALYRIGPEAKGALPALLAAAKTKDRLFRQSVIMALRKIDPEAMAKAGLK
jgi:HEAT repeat protein